MVGWSLRSTASRTSFALLAALGSVALGACAGREPCSVAGDCADGTTCVLGSCQPGARVPVGDGSQRVVAFPKDVAAIGETLEGSGHATLTLGGRGVGDAAILLSFEHGVALDADVEAAWILLDPAPAASSASDFVEIEARDVPAPFDGGALDWRRRPPLGRPVSTTRTRGAEAAPLRIDVTKLVRAWLHAGKREGRVALLSRASTDLGATFTTGLGVGLGPRLEVYLR